MILSLAINNNIHWFLPESDFFFLNQCIFRNDSYFSALYLNCARSENSWPVTPKKLPIFSHSCIFTDNATRICVSTTLPRHLIKRISANCIPRFNIIRLVLRASDINSACLIVTEKHDFSHILLMYINTLKITMFLGIL